MLEIACRHVEQKCCPDITRVCADSGYAKPWFYCMCEQLVFEYSIGIDMNNVLKRNSEELLRNAVEQHEKTGEPQRSSPALTTRSAPFTRVRIASASLLQFLCASHLGLLGI